MAIFISHASADNQIAAKVFNRLKIHHRIGCYLDDIDERLRSMRGRPGLTPYLVRKIKEHDTLLAVVTQNTQQSWWVPFEIGTAREIPIIITSYTNLLDPLSGNYSGRLPEYLLEWPRLRTDQDIDIFANKYKERQRFQERAADFSDRVFMGLPSDDDTRDFEIKLMDSLGQRSFV